MAAVSQLFKNIIEVSQHFHNGKVMPEVAMLAQNNAILSDIPWKECNDGTTHLYDLQTALPAVEKVAHGQPTTPSKGARARERAHTTILSGFSTVPRDTVMVGGAMGALRAKEDANFQESIRQLFAKMLFYDNRANSLLDIYGLSTLYNSLTGVKAKNTLSCSDGTPAANAQTSIYFVNWGEDCYGVFPKGLPAGYHKDDLGKQVVTDANGKKIVMMETEHKWYVGLVIEAWMSAGRICNIDVADAAALASFQAPTVFTNVLHKTLEIKRRFRRPGKLVAYCNDTTATLITRLGAEKSANAVTWGKAAGQFGEFDELRVHGIPFRVCDQILNTEPVVS